ncbi:uncharacterized protein LOC135372802 isoform X1 [Ornithodoros turicata]|uniref:uncharacterized protein LOC135372802 isoform X1 n=1 Tax=Ornithodoros turicata TaxID=34597 RepID=UPI0031394A56
MPKHTHKTFLRHLDREFARSIQKISSTTHIAVPRRETQPPTHDVLTPQGHIPVSVPESNKDAEDSRQEYLGGAGVHMCSGTSTMAGIGNTDTEPENLRAIPSPASEHFPEADERTYKDAFCDKLRQWSIMYHIPHDALTALLKLLQSCPSHESVPGCARTLLRTPRTSTKVVQMGSGKYCHFGLSSGLQHVLQNALHLPDVLSLHFNIDGLPLSRSTRDQFWPILCRTANCGDGQPFFVGVYYGKSKPSDVNIFLRPFVTEVQEVLESGIAIQHKLVGIKITVIVCDAPARAFVLSVKSHSGFHSCTKCTIRGDYKNGRVCFPVTQSQQRTNENFRNFAQNEHHTGETILTELPIDIITAIPLDFMHLACLGVVRKLLQLWFSGPRSSFRQSSRTCFEVSQKHTSLRKHVCSEFSRKPRSLLELDTWKATELRLVLLYTGPVVLKSSIPSTMYCNFMVLHCALTILASAAHVEEHLRYARELLLYFVNTFASIYGEGRVSYNIHGLLHLADDVENHGPVDLWSAFPFENYMQQVKRWIRKPERPLEQLFKRVTEEMKLPYSTRKAGNCEVTLSLEHDSGPLPIFCEGPQYKKVAIGNKYVLRNTCGDNCCVLLDGSVIEVQNIALFSTTRKPCIIGRRFLQKNDLYTFPCPSSSFGIYAASGLSDTSAWPLEIVSSKCMKLPFQGQWAIFPLLHSQLLRNSGCDVEVA